MAHFSFRNLSGLDHSGCLGIHLFGGHGGLHHDAGIGVVVRVVAREEVAGRLELDELAPLVPPVAAPTLRTPHQETAPLHKPGRKGGGGLLRESERDNQTTLTTDGRQIGFHDHQLIHHDAQIPCVHEVLPRLQHVFSTAKLLVKGCAKRRPGRGKLRRAISVPIFNNFARPSAKLWYEGAKVGEMTRALQHLLWKRGV